MSYPWIKDSQYGTNPLVTDYLEVTSPNGLYFNNTGILATGSFPLNAESISLTSGSNISLSSGPSVDINAINTINMTTDDTINLFSTNGVTVNTISGNSDGELSAGTINATTFNGALNGNASTATNISGGLGGQILYQSAVDTTAKLENGDAGKFLKSQGTTLPPVWDTPAGNATTIDITNTENNATYYPTFVSGSGSQTLRADITTTPFEFIPSTGELRRTIADATNGTAFSMTCINTTTGANSRRFSKLTCNSGRNVSFLPPSGILSAQMDDQNYSECVVEGENFDLNTTQLYDDDSLKAGVRGYKEPGGIPVSVLYNNNTNFVPGNIEITGVRVKQQPNRIEMFTGSTIDAAVNIASFFINGVADSAGIIFNQLASGITPKNESKNTTIPTTAWVYNNLPYNNPNNSRFLGSGGIIASNVDAVHCGNALSITLNFIYYYAVYLSAGTVVSKAIACTTGGTGTTANAFRMALFSGSGFVLASTGSMSGNGTVAGNFGSAYTVTSNGFYYIAIQPNGTASPTFSATNATSGTAQAINFPNTASQGTSGNLAYYRSATTAAAAPATGGFPSPTYNYTINALGIQIWVAVA